MLADRIEQDPSIVLEGDLLEEMMTDNPPENLYVVQLPQTPGGVLRVSSFNVKDFKQSKKLK